MKERCRNPHNKRYDRYGGRGISVCEEWMDFSAFRDWMLANGYRQGLSIDRIDSDGNYTPENCRLVDTATQNRNYSRNHLLTYNGQTKCIQEWAEETGLLSTTILFRLRSGMTAEEALQNIDRRSIRFKKTNL